jgi:hypothetical protein
MVIGARSLVLVDDEITTGNTFANLRAALVNAGLNRVAKTRLVCLTDWSDGEAARRLPNCDTSALVVGSYEWTPDPEAVLPEMPAVDATGTGEHSPDPSKDWGRLGVVGHVSRHMDEVLPGERVLVLGVGEHVWQPFLLAEALEQGGAEVLFSSVTRSPIAVGHEIASALHCRDNYGQGIANFVYNVDPSRHDRILLCVETPASSVDTALVRALGPSLRILDMGGAA